MRIFAEKNVFQISGVPGSDRIAVSIVQGLGFAAWALVTEQFSPPALQYTNNGNVCGACVKCICKIIYIFK